MYDPSSVTPAPEPGRPGASDTPEPTGAGPSPRPTTPGATTPQGPSASGVTPELRRVVPGATPESRPDALGAHEPRPSAPLVDEHPTARPFAAGAESAWSARFVRLGAPRPGPAARRARWFGVPLVPLLTAALVAGAFLTARGGAEAGGIADGRAGGEALGVPSPVVTGGTGPAAPTPANGAGTADTPSTETPTHPTTVSATPTPSASDKRVGDPEGSPSPTSSRSGSTTPTPGTPSTRATPSGRPTGARPPERPVSFEALRVGECFDIDRDAPGTALRRRCDAPHRAELVARPRLVGTFATDQAVREAATLLCREPLRRKAARQPVGTRWTTFVQYPYRTSHLLGADTVACSLAATDGTLSHRLQ
ncbi:hypothetical protein GCM10010299_25650 [Streptomyces tanashiensis]|nr:hypothetical protein GCM10010299_25650 [Streptomyces tanashiensis]